jgi:hypothetical protein
MALSTRVNAVHGINRYLYEKGKGRIFSPEAVYGGRSAFAPIKEVEAFSKRTFTDQYGTVRPVPYIVYNWTIPRITENWFMQSERIVYLVYSTDEAEIRKISNYIVDSLKQFDRSATNVQAWLEKLPGEKWAGETTNPYSHLELYTINVEGADGPNNIEDSGGRMEAIITVTVTYGIVENLESAYDED